MALAISCVGLYGLVGYAVVQQRRALGVRLALGAQRRDLFRRRLRAEHSGRRVARNDLKGEKHQNGDCKDREDKDAYFF